MSLVHAEVERSIRSVVANKRGEIMLNLDNHRQQLYKIQDEVSEMKVSL